MSNHAAEFRRRIKAQFFNVFIGEDRQIKIPASQYKRSIFPLLLGQKGLVEIEVR
jgi:hypothetical protein